VQESAPKNDKTKDRLATDLRVSFFEGAENPVTPSIKSSQFKLPPRPSRLKPQLNQQPSETSKMQKMTTTALLKDFITANLPKLEDDHQSEAQLKRKE
jgi:hypothetical protein